MFSFNLNPEIKLPKLLPKDPGFDLTVHLSNNQSFYLQKVLLSEFSKYFQSLLSLKGLSEVTISADLGKPEVISRIFHIIYGDTVNFDVNELQEIDRALDNLDCKRIKEVLKASLKEELLRTESLDFFLRVFDHFAIRDHKKFCKESLRRLNELKFFESILIEVEGNCPKEVLPTLGLMSERGVTKLLALILQDETRKRGGEKARGNVCAMIKNVVFFYAKEVLKKPERGEGIFEELMLEINPLEKKYLDKDVINTLQMEIQQLKKTNQSLNNQIQGLRSKENENKKRMNGMVKRIEVLEGILKVKHVEEHAFHNTHQGMQSSNGTNSNNNANNTERSMTIQNHNNSCNNNNVNIEKGVVNSNINVVSNSNNTNESSKSGKSENKFKGYLDNEENKRKKQMIKPPQMQEKKKEEKKENSMNSENQTNVNKKPKSPFGVFNNEKELPRLLDFLKKHQEDLKDSTLSFSRIYEGSKQGFQLKNLIELAKEGLLQNGVLTFIRTHSDKTIGAYFSKGLEANAHKEDPRSFIFMLNPFKIFSLKQEFMASPVVLLKEDGWFIGQDLIIANEGNKNHSCVEIPRYYGDAGDDMMNGILAGVKSFLMKEMIVVGVKKEG